MMLLSLRSLKVDCFLICFSIFPVTKVEGAFLSLFWSSLIFTICENKCLPSHSSSLSISSVGSWYTLQWPLPCLDNPGRPNIYSLTYLLLFHVNTKSVLLFFCLLCQWPSYFEGCICVFLNRLHCDLLELLHWRCFTHIHCELLLR